MRLTGDGDGFQAPANAEERSNKTPSGAANTLGRFTGAKEPMNTTMLQPDPHAVKHGRFVPAMSEYDQGRELYKSGKPITDCVTDEMADGWNDAEWAGYMAYSRHMEAEGVPAAKAFSYRFT